MRYFVMKIFNEYISENLKQFREEMSISIDNISKLLGMSNRRYIFFENTGITLTHRIIYFCLKFNVLLDWLVGLINENTYLDIDNSYLNFLNNYSINDIDMYEFQCLIHNIVAKRLTIFRRSENILFIELTEVSGFSSSSSCGIARYASNPKLGKKNIILTIDRSYEISRSCGVSLDWLYGLSNEMYLRIDNIDKHCDDNIFKNKLYYTLYGHFLHKLMNYRINKKFSRIYFSRILTCVCSVYNN